jgi:hypothetical protein
LERQTETYRQHIRVFTSFLERKKEKIDRKKGIGGAKLVPCKQCKHAPAILGLSYPY